MSQPLITTYIHCHPNSDLLHNKYILSLGTIAITASRVPTLHYFIYTYMHIFTHYFNNWCAYDSVTKCLINVVVNSDGNALIMY